MPIRMECCPAFNYARSKHETSIISDDSIPDPTLVTSPSSPESPTESSKQYQPQLKALFESDNLSLDLRFVAEGFGDERTANSAVLLQILDLTKKGCLGHGVFCDMQLAEGQVVTFVLRVPPEAAPPAGSKPTRAQAKQLGVPMKSRSFYDWDGFEDELLFLHRSSPWSVQVEVQR